MNLDATITLTVNGKKKEIPVDVRQSLLEVLREQLGMISVKQGCAVGECGACTVLIDEVPIIALGPVEQANFSDAAHHDDFSHRSRELQIHLAALRHIGDADMPTGPMSVYIHLPLRGIECSSDEAEECGFSCTIRTNNGDPLTGWDFERNVLQSLVTIEEHSHRLHINRGRFGPMRLET